MKRATLLLLLFMLSLFPATVHAEAEPDSFAATVNKVASSVVGIRIAKREPSPIPGEPTHLIFASGSGFAIKEGGYILSNAHVLDHAIWAQAITSTGQVYDISPRQIWADAVADLAVAKIAANLPPVAWADVTKLRLGDSVFAMGAPYGLRFRGSVSRGIISGFERKLDADYSFIQTDSPINPGNSGGPLFNLKGEVVGVNARGIRGADGMGFAIPADVTQEIAAKLIADGKVERAWLGLRFEDSQDVNLGYRVDLGPVVTMVEETGPAAKSGIQVGDTLLRLGSTTVESIEDVAKFLRSVTPGTPIKVAYRRGDEDLDTTLTVATRPHDADLFLSAEGLWVGLTPAQAQRARLMGEQSQYLELDDLLDPWTTYVGDSKAVLLTEYVSLARLSWELVRQEKPMTREQADAELPKLKGFITVQVDLPTRFRLGAPESLWAEWQDRGGKVRAMSVQVVGSAPPGYQRVLVRVRSQLIEQHGVGTLVLHLQDGVDRRFSFYLDGIH